jgi:hypothetical protein
MPILGDYLGHLFSEITAARMQADLETARIAETYAAHPLLRLMPVPRFRAPNITLEVPVSVTRMEEAAPGQPRRGGLTAAAVKTAVISAIDTTLVAANVKVTARVRSEVRKAGTNAAARLAQPAEIALTSRCAQELAQAVADAVVDAMESREELAADSVERLRNDLRLAAAAAIANAIVPAPRLHVAVTTRELRESGPPEMLARLKLTISEEGMEWSVSESNGATTSRLVPE